MRKLAVGIAIASLTLLTACGDDAEEPTEPVASEPADDSSSEPAEDESSEPAGSGDTPVLTGMVGTEDDPDAFEISLVDDTGEAVTELPAGDYTIEINDPTAIHNFHLMGGSVDESTTVDEVTEVTWEVTLEAGDYTFVCDPHPPMSGSFTVT